VCGIFGILIGEGSSFSAKLLKETVDRLFNLSESRGKEAAGIAVRTGKSIYVFKEPVSASDLTKSEKYNDIFHRIITEEVYADKDFQVPFAVIGHSRLVTNGQSELNSNNQPVVKDGAVGIHNGIIVNDSDLWAAFPALKRKYNVDTEIFLSLLQMSRNGAGSILNAVKKTFDYIKGSASVAILFDDVNLVPLATNVGSLYVCPSKDEKLLVFASERYILIQLLESKSLSNLFNADAISQVRAGSGLLVNLFTMECQKFSLKEDDFEEPQMLPRASDKLSIHDLSPLFAVSASPRKDLYRLREDVKREMMKNWERLYSQETSLKRCTKCILPETMPYISFDEEGVCNYCRNYEERERQGYKPLKGEKALEELVSKHRSQNGEPDCIVGLSGGRDSAYGINYIKNVLKLNPIAFTYDWAMVVDLARRNQARICSYLGIEQIVVSADIRKKRANIRKNLNAWLKRPDLGMIPILMAGDKKFYYYFHKIREQTGVKLFIFSGGHEIEETRFKYGFCNVSHGVKNEHNRLTGISAVNKLKMIAYYAKNFLLNPAYINSSMLDTLDAYYCTYILNDDYIYLYHYINWDEDEVVSTIRKEFDWEMSPYTKATWRIDDGTAAFYNYIYMTMAGLTEFDDFRSFQIRQGKIGRKEAWDLVREENKPRFEEIEWYAEAIDYDINKAINRINSAPRLYS
jgi:asparagine synthetase B (glutamine-hydrolysing)